MNRIVRSGNATTNNHRGTVTLAPSLRDSRPLWLTQPEISTSRLMPASSPRCVPVAVQMPQNGKAGTQILAVAVAPSTLSVTGVMTDVAY